MFLEIILLCINNQLIYNFSKNNLKLIGFHIIQNILFNDCGVIYLSHFALSGLEGCWELYLICC